MSKCITVAICTWNRSRLLGQTLESFLHLRIPEGVSWELLVINNNCTDDTDQVVGQYLHRLPIKLCHEQRPGLSNARNHAIEQARGEFILWTDDDVLVDPNWLMEILKTFDDYKADLLFGKVLPWWETAPPRWFSPYSKNILVLVDLGSELEVLRDAWKCGAGVNCAFRREALLRLGSFRADLGVCQDRGGGEDIDMYRRAYAAGLRVVYTPAALVRHYIPAVRCRKNYHRRRAWVDSPNYLRVLRGDAQNVPKLLGIPRYFFRRNLGFVREFLFGLLTGDSGRTFFYELKLISFAGLLWNMMLPAPDKTASR